MVKAISGVQTVRFKNELVRNITIKLGYANAKVSSSHMLRGQWTDGNADDDLLLAVVFFAPRSTSVATMPVRDLDATSHSPRARRTTPYARGQDVAVQCS